MPASFNPLDLAPDERMADRRIEIAQIGEAHAPSTAAGAAIGHSKGSDECESACRRNGGGWPSDVPAGKRLGDEVRLVARVKLVAQILDMSFDRAGSNAELLGALLGGEPACDALKHFTLALGQGDEIFLLPRKIHHRSPYWAKTSRPALIALVIAALQELERAVPNSDDHNRSNERMGPIDLILEQF